jgi:undecaprenyl-diphosphatase
LAFLVLTAPVLFGRDWPGEWAVVEWALSTRSPFWTAAMQAVTFFGSSVVGLGVATGATAAVLLRDRRLTRQSFLPLAAMLGSAPINLSLRAAIGRYRPGVSYIPHKLPEIAHPFQRWSYPAGHAMTALICYGMLAYLFLQAYPHLRRLTSASLALWLGLIGFSRVYLGVHWPTDVLGGYLIGGCWLALCVALLGAGRVGLRAPRG